jgi:hypothetical protein
MGLRTEVFYIARGIKEVHALNELLSRLRRDAVEDISIVQPADGATAMFVTYEATEFGLVGSSPLDGQSEVAVETAVHILFDEDLAGDLSLAAGALSAYRNGQLVVLTGAEVAISGNRLIITDLIDNTAGAYYQLVVGAELLAASGRHLGSDSTITWKTT